MNDIKVDIVSYKDDKERHKKTILIYDTHKRRVLEKWVSYETESEEPEFEIANRYIYTYNHFNVLNSKIEIERSTNHDFNGRHNEYSNLINRQVKQINLSSKFLTEIKYSRINYIGFDMRKRLIKSVFLEIKQDITGFYKIKIKYLLERGKLFKYKYNKNNLDSLFLIDEYKILLDLRIINKIFKSIGNQWLIDVPDLYLKIKTKSVLYSESNEMVKHKYHNQDYFKCVHYNPEHTILIHKTVIKEDFFVNEMSSLNITYNKTSSIS
jgi:hypothetical protein